ncbi:bacteriocin fulvocin C-related protein [Nonomuraea sp. NPDC050202]|uniref:bacteriocin fulvocin C-related protein n=1 Tax=Nonomuraea sp. NPDC050202 TaxID=3155035 RepID=UPI0033ED044A
MQANKDQLPKMYPEFSKLSMPYRQAVYQELTASDKAHLWDEHFKAYLRTRPQLSSAQQQVVAEAQSLARDATVHDPAKVTTPELQARLSHLTSASIAEFGKDEAGAVFATLGPSELAAPIIQCHCNTTFDFCGGGGKCYEPPTVDCRYVTAGCGPLWVTPCNGGCLYW